MGALAAPLVAGVGSAVAGKLLGGDEGGGAATQSIPFTPTTVSSGIGSAYAAPGEIATTLSPELQAMQRGLLKQAGGYFGQPAQTPGALTGAGTAASQASQGAFGALGSFNPQEATQQQYNLMQQLLGPTQERQRLGLEERLFQQGLLGSTAGGIQQQALQEAQNRSTLEAMLHAQTAAQQQQSHLAGLGTTIGAFGSQMAMLPYQLQAAKLGLGTTALGAAMSPQEMLLRQADLARMTQPSSFAYTPPPTMGQTIGAGLIAGGAEQFGSGLAGLFNQGV